MDKELIRLENEIKSLKATLAVKKVCYAIMKALKDLGEENQQENKGENE